MDPMSLVARWTSSRNLPAIRLVTAICTMALLAGCANSVRLKDTWRSPAAPAKSYKKLLVVAVTHNDSLRGTLENILAETLADHGVAAVPSHKLISDIGAADKALLQATAQASGADGVIITRAISKSEHTDYQYLGGSVQERSAVMVKAGEDSTTVVAMSVVGIAPREMDFVEGYLQTRLFDAASAGLVWAAHSKVVNDGNTGEACWDFAILITKALARDHLVELNAREFRKPNL